MLAIRRFFVALVVLGISAAPLIAGGITDRAGAATPCSGTVVGPIFNPLNGDPYSVYLIAGTQGGAVCLDEPGTDGDPYGGAGVGAPPAGTGTATHVQACNIPAGACLVNEKAAAYVDGTLAPSTGGTLVCVGSICVPQVVGTGLVVHLILHTDSQPTVVTLPEENIAQGVCVGVLAAC
ncbi:MAG TPA: hypothetical protein VFA94_11970 [Acidimicrobiales bacterium]|nr:hypothetical protein [Acidimicrobiales bacterium]